VVVVVAGVVVVVVACVASDATVVVGAPVTHSPLGEVTLTIPINTIGTTANTETRCIDERSQRVTKIPATTAKIAKTASVTLLPVVGNTQRSVPIMSAPYRKFNNET
jgi:hypothetical protein